MSRGTIFPSEYCPGGHVKGWDVPHCDNGTWISKVTREYHDNPRIVHLVLPLVGSPVYISVVTKVR